MKFCGKCGAQLNDDDMFCLQCGAKQDGGVAQQPTQQAGDANNAFKETVENVGENIKKVTSKIDKKLLPIIGGAAVLAVVLVIVLCKLFFSSGSMTKTGAVKAYCEAVYGKDAKGIVDSSFSPSMLKALEAQTDMNKKEIIAVYKLGFMRSTKYKVRKIKVVDKEKWDRDDVKDMKEDIKDKTGKSVRISKVYDVEIEFQYYDKDEKEWIGDDMSLTIYKSGSKWYAFNDEIFDDMY